MLPTSKEYLARSGLSDTTAAYTLIGLFVAGVIIINLFSSIVHRFIPSHIVDCNHTHDPQDENGGTEEYHHHQIHKASHDEEMQQTIGTTEHTPLLTRSPGHGHNPSTRPVLALTTKTTGQIRPLPQRKKSMRQMLGRQVSKFLRGTKQYCDENGSCYGISQTCGKECTKVLSSQSASAVIDSISVPDRISTPPLMTDPGQRICAVEPETPMTVRHIPTDNEVHRPMAYEQQSRDYFSQDLEQQVPPTREDDEELTPQGSEESTSDAMAKPWEQHSTHSSAQHHHHVPQNAFLSIGLQTSLAIALHKLPEGFITYATNHANPTLGMTVFLALFIHNITDGFALALPLFLALRSRPKAIFWASLLGGISQPAGAGIAAIWIWCTTRGRDGSITDGTSWGVYGGMFAATAGIMTSVGLQLFSEGLSLTHSRQLCIASAIIGMGILGVSFALTS
jgi:ZIP family zinc transporter